MRVVLNEVRYLISALGLMAAEMGGFVVGDPDFRPGTCPAGGVGQRYNLVFRTRKSIDAVGAMHSDQRLHTIHRCWTEEILISTRIR